MSNSKIAVNSSFLKGYADLFLKYDSHLAQAIGRDFSRAAELMRACSREDEPGENYVVATNNGRALEKLSNGGRTLDIGDKPQCWTQQMATAESAHWNRDHPPEDHVFPEYWRNFYAAQITRIRFRILASAPEIGPPPDSLFDVPSS